MNGMYKNESNTAFTQKSRNEPIRKLWAGIALMLLAACGGGGSGSSDSPPSQEPEAMVALQASANGYSIEDSDANSTGPLETLLDFANNAEDRLNEIISDTGSVLLNADELEIVFDYKNNRFTVNGELYSDSVEDVDEDDLVYFLIKE